MSQKTSDQGWQQLQAHIEGFLGQTLRNDVQRIEYKPRFIVQLLEMPSERHQNELQEMKGLKCQGSVRRRPHGHTGFKKLMLGSVAFGVLHEAHVPVLIHQAGILPPVTIEQTVNPPLPPEASQPDRSFAHRTTPSAKPAAFQSRNVYSNFYVDFFKILYKISLNSKVMTKNPRVVGGGWIRMISDEKGAGR